jgi:hypothetical protein
MKITPMNHSINNYNIYIHIIPWNNHNQDMPISSCFPTIPMVYPSGGDLWDPPTSCAAHLLRARIGHKKKAKHSLRSLKREDFGEFCPDLWSFSEAFWYCNIILVKNVDCMIVPWRVWTGEKLPPREWPSPLGLEAKCVTWMSQLVSG